MRAQRGSVGLWASTEKRREKVDDYGRNSFAERDRMILAGR